MLNSYLIKDLKIKPNLVLAPMSGVTHAPFRRLIKELNGDCVGLMLSEFISVEALTRGVDRSLQMINFSEMERPYGVQIFGYDVDRMCEAARLVQDQGVDLIDINCGCPAPKVVRKGGGCELMRQPEHLKKMLRTLRKVVSIPLTLKMRAGWNANHVNAIEIAQIAEGEGLDALAIHPRTRAQAYKGECDWTLAKQVVEAVNVPVLASGNVKARDAACELINQGFAGVMIGRGALSNPLIFKELATGQKHFEEDQVLLVVKILERYIELVCNFFDPRCQLGKIKQLAAKLGKGRRWRKALCLAQSIEEFRARLYEMLEEYSEDVDSCALAQNYGTISRNHLFSYIEQKGRQVKEEQLVDSE